MTFTTIKQSLEKFLPLRTKEHREIVRAIRTGAVAQARAAMRRHLLNSRKRYQAFASKLGSA